MGHGSDAARPSALTDRTAKRACDSFPEAAAYLVTTSTDVAVRDDVGAPDALAVEPRGRAPDERARARRAELVVDAVGDVGHGRAGAQRERLVVGPPSRRG